VFRFFKQPQDISLCVFLLSCVLELGNRVNYLWCYFLSVMSAVILAHLVFHTTNCLITPSLHWLMLSGTFRFKILVINSTGRIVSEICPFQSQTLTVCRNVCNHLASDVISYNRRKIRLFIPLRKPTNSRNCMNQILNFITQKLLHIKQAVPLYL